VLFVILPIDSSGLASSQEIANEVGLRSGRVRQIIRLNNFSPNIIQLLYMSKKLPVTERLLKAIKKKEDKALAFLSLV